MTPERAMTRDTHGEIVNAQLNGDQIVYTAKHSDGSVIRGVIGRERGNAFLSDTSMEQLREQLVGKKIEWPETFDPSSNAADELAELTGRDRGEFEYVGEIPQFEDQEIE